MMLFKPFIDPDASIDFYASNERSYQELLPIYAALANDGRQGTFYVSRQVKTISTPVTKITTNKLDGFAPLLVSSYKDLHDVYVIGEERPFILLENSHSANTAGLIKIVSLFLCKDERTYTARKLLSKDVIRISDANDAAQKIIEYLKGLPIVHIDNVNGHSVGLLYMAWGEKAFEGVKRSIASLKRLGYSYPVAVISDFPNKPSADEKPSKYTLIRIDKNPFDITKAKNFQFRAGRVKPHLCDLSPFEFNLYIDADTQFLQPIHEAFTMLHDFDLIVTDEKLALKDLYNKFRAAWELNIEERDTTIIEIGGDEDQKFINSGVLFFRKNKKTSKLFNTWHNEWIRFQEWDEQLALMRAIHKHPEIKVAHLPVIWNSPHLTDDTVIFHNYGRGAVRTNYD
jgi:hypothetical protein